MIQIFFFWFLSSKIVFFLVFQYLTSFLKNDCSHLLLKCGSKIVDFKIFYQTFLPRPWPLWRPPWFFTVNPWVTALALGWVWTRAFTGRDVPLSLCPGTKKFPCPAFPLSWDKNKFLVPLSQDKSSSKNPGTNSSVPGRLGTKNVQKRPKFSKKNFLLLFPFCPMIVPGFSGTGRDRLSKSRPSPSHGKISKPCPVPCPRFWLAVPARPGLWQDFELVLLSLCPGTMKEFLSLCPEKLHCPVPLETLVWTMI